MTSAETQALPSFDRPFTGLLDTAFRQFAGRECLRFGRHRMTYGEVDAASARVANTLFAAGFEVGMKAAVYSLNSSAAFVATLGILRAGGVWLPVNPRNSESDNIDGLAQLGCDALFYEMRFAEAAETASQRCPGMKAMVALDAAQGQAAGLEQWSAAASAQRPEVPLTGRHLLSIPMTGGTTGRPKGVMLSHRNFCALEYAMRTAYLQPEAVMLCAAPMTHVGGRLAMTALTSGTRLVILDKVDPQLILQTIERERVTDLFLPPTSIYALLDQPNLKQFDLSSLRSIAYGSAPMSVPRLREALERLGPVMVGGFGQTECPMFITMLRREEHLIDGRIAPDSRLRSVGRATCISKVAILDDAGQVLPPGQQGEIAVRGGNVAEGYYGQPDETAKIRANGWHLTGDIGYLDGEGFLFIVDRKKDMIITGGFNVYSVEVEQVLMAMPGVREAAVIGVPSDKWGEEVKALVTIEPGYPPDAVQILELCKKRLGSVKTPKSVEFVEELPRTALGKVDKKLLRSRYGQVPVRT